MLTTQDLKQIRIIVEEVVDDKTKFLPTTDIFLTKMDEVMGELQKTRDEQDSLSYRVSVHSDEISTLQDLHPNGQHPVAI